jgi:hypothetical protein
VRRPVCVHATAPREARGGKDEAGIARAQRALAALELAYERVVLGASLPPPATDDGAGGGDELDWYLDAPGVELDASLDAESSPPLVSVESLPTRSFDRAAAYCLGTSADLERSATLCVAEASAAARSPAQGPGLRRAYATEVWWTVGTPTAEDEAALFRTQHAPEQPVLTRRQSELSEGNAVFFAYLDDLGTRPAPARTSTSALALAATHTKPGSLRFRAEPDVADVMRGTFLEQRDRVARFWDEFARARFLTDRPDGWLAWAS